MERKDIVSSLDLDCYLNEIFKDRIETDFIAAAKGGVQGRLDGKVFNITFAPEKYALISMDKNAEHELSVLVTVLTDVMNDSPICSYDMKSEGLEYALPTIEWDVENPEARIKEIVNGRAFTDKPVISNLKLYGDRKIEDYVETKEEQEDRIKNARIYGIDPGKGTDTEAIDKLSELDLYLAIDALGGFLSYMRHEMAHDRIEYVDLTEEEYRMEYLVYQTRKFGVELPDAEIDKHVSATPSYWAWLKFYDNHFKHELSNEEWNTFVKKRESGEDVSEYLPTGNWKDSLEEEKKRERK